jgi:Protein of unknown function (DUF4019)
VIPRQYRIHVVLMLAAALMIIMPILSEIPDQEQADAATAAATDFLVRIDADQFDSSWEMASKLLQERVPRDTWNEQLTTIREKAGALVSREQDDVSYSTTAKDSPDGDYIQIFYKSRFAKKGDLQEIISTTLEADGHWRVAGYFVQ